MNIQSVYYNQSDILSAILSLNEIDTFDADVSYGNGAFYKNIEKPTHRFDIDASRDDCMTSCSTQLPLCDSVIGSLVFDPPFLTYVKSARAHDSIMAKRFGGYWRYDELEYHYKGTLKEAARVLRKKGIMVFKCQDIIHNHKMHATHMNVIQWAQEYGFRLKDLFILAAKHRMPMPEKKGEKKRKQKHARIHHSYFLVLELK